MERSWPASALGIVLTVLVLATSTGCQQATSDPDTAVKTLITSTTWDSDTTNYPVATDNETQLTIRFVSDGTAYLNGKSANGTWSYKSGVFTLTTPAGTYTTAAADLVIDASHFDFTYVTGLCHLVPLAAL
jgi:hypothetical protein